jgi:uroporphyrinogen-III synthase
MPKVYFVGAGPGDPDLITVKGRRALESAGVVLFDHLAPAALLALAPAQAERICAQGEICATLIDRARRGSTVVRLMTGDPLLFGSGSEEVEALAEAGVPFEIVPGHAAGAIKRGPLFGQRIVVTRSSGQAGALSSRLELLGAAVIELPTIEIQAAADYGPLDRAIAQLASYDWLIFTSANGVRAFVERMDRSVADLRSLRARLCAIGPATRAAIEALHLKVDLVGTEYVAEGLLQAFASHPLEGARILLPRAAVARDVIPAELARRGAQVDVVEAYRTALPQDAAARAREIFGGSPKPDWIAFTSSSTVRNFVSVAGAEALAGVRVASIGPVTSQTAREFGIEVAVEARAFTIDGLVEAMLR